MKFLFAALMAGWMVLVANANAADKVDFQCGDVDAEAQVSVDTSEGGQSKAPKSQGQATSLNERKPK